MSTVPHYLPAWAQWVQVAAAVATTIVTASAVIVFGWWQTIVAREKLKHDLYDRRYAIFLAFHRLINALLAGHDLKPHFDETVFLLPQARFLLSDKVAKHLHELYREVFSVYHSDKNYIKLKGQFDNQQTLAMVNDIIQRKSNLIGAVDELEDLFISTLELKDLARHGPLLKNPFRRFRVRSRGS